MGEIMKKFRKKPVVIEAIQFTGSFANFDQISDFVGQDIAANSDGDKTVMELFIETLEGTHKAVTGDWIIKGVEGEFYPCKPSIFAATYDEINETGEKG
jgi:hypothetical protein